jgi:arginase family enzyme
MANIISGFYEARGVKPVVINLDFHSDARRSDDGPHSGTWLSDAYQRGEVAHSYIIGLSLLANSEIVMANLEAFQTRFLDFTWDSIQMAGGSRVALPLFADVIIKDIHERFGREYPVLFTIDGDTVQGLPCSAQNEVLGYPPEDVYPLISQLTRNLNLVSLSVAELKPSLDKSKNAATGEFLSASLFLYARCLEQQ